MIGAAVYRLKAEGYGYLPEMHGRLLHAAFFAALRKLSPDLSAYVHDKMNVKPFTVSLLHPEGPVQKGEAGWSVRKGMRFFWRATGLNESMVYALAALTEGTRLMAGRIPFVVEQATLNPDDHREAGVADENDLINQCLSVPSIQEITFHFRSPVSFRSGKHDFPWPLASYVFGSLADKWTQAGMPGVFDKREIHAEAEAIHPLAWRGASQIIYPADERGMLVFTGTFSYSLNMLEEERRRAFLILAQFSTFSGVGRLTGQGLGESRITYR